MESNKKRVYSFGGKTAEGNGTMRELLGGKDKPPAWTTQRRNIRSHSQQSTAYKAQ